MQREPSERNAGGRGSLTNPSNRYETLRVASCEEHAAWCGDAGDEAGEARTQVLPDESRSIIASNNSPDIPFSYSINPYRGCEHGCAYCYARPTHERLGMSAGLDFEAKILVKSEAGQLLRRKLCDSSWRGEPIALSGVTDCYQPLERQQRVTRSILEVMREASQPVMICTKNALVLRDLEVLVELARWDLVRVTFSITTLDPKLARVLEPRASTPAARLRAVRELRESGVPVSVLVAPVIAGLTDHEMAAVLQAAAEAGARSAAFALLRLPPPTDTVFLDWLQTHRPSARQRVESLIRSTRGGGLDDSRYGFRLHGQAGYATGIASSFRLFARKFGLDTPPAPLNQDRFRPPRDEGGQLRLF
ncbi:MAG: PA0069 family radical SAM protein [Pirellulaceae bacterium]